MTAWLRIQRRSLTLDLLRRRRSQTLKTARLAAHGAGAMVEPVEDLLNLVQEGTAVRRALGALSEIQRRLIMLAFFDDLSHQDIAAAVNLPPRRSGGLYPSRPGITGWGVAVGAGGNSRLVRVMTKGGFVSTNSRYR